SSRATGRIVCRHRWVHSCPVSEEPAMQISEELAALIKRADGATATARRLLDENDRWRRSVERQLDRLFELGAEFRKPSLSRPVAMPDQPAGVDRRPAVRSGCGGAPIRPGSA